jgi:hypothetical protein
MAGWPVVHLLQTDLAKSVETPLCPYIRIHTVEDSITHSTCSSPLVKVRFSSCSASKFHTQFLCQNHVLIICMTQDQLFHTYGQMCSQITKSHE